MKKNPNPNLWSIKFTTRHHGTIDLWILGATAATAEQKAKRKLKRERIAGAKVMSINHEGTIDVF